MTFLHSPADDPCDAETIVLPSKLSKTVRNSICCFFLLIFLEFVEDVNLRLGRRSNSEWRRLNSFKTAALSVVAEDEFTLKSAMVSPVKNKRSGDKKPRASRIKGLLPESDQSDEFKRASQLNFGGKSLRYICVIFTLCVVFQISLPHHLIQLQLLYQVTHTLEFR